jgi:hypothetical protein
VPVELPSQELLRERLSYDPETGILTWAYSRPGITKGKVVGHPNKTGYWQVMLDRKSYQAHRLIWKWMTGEDPPQFIDHVNHDRHDNRWENLRLATQAENAQNSRGSGKYKKGVSKSTCGVTFEAKITVDGKRHFLGCFETEDEAHQEYCRAAEFVHGQFACYDSRSREGSR